MVITMTQKEKAKAYDEALERARKLYNSEETSADVEIACETIFPELAESEDERIRQAIIDFFEFQDDNTTYSLVSKKDILAWLEKQGESGTFNIPQTPIKDAVEVTSRMQFISDDMKPIAEFIMGYANWDLHKDEWNQPTLTVPLFRVLDALIQRGKPYGECSQNIEKQGEQKPKWTEEDSLMIDSIIDTIKWLEGKGATNMKIDWLKSLKQRMEE